MASKSTIHHQGGGTTTVTTDDKGNHQIEGRGQGQMGSGHTHDEVIEKYKDPDDKVTKDY